MLRCELGDLGKQRRGLALDRSASCRVGDSVRIRATLSQASTGAVAEGLWSKRCTGTLMHWHITAIVTDGAHFSAGGDDGAGLAIIRRHGMPGSAIQWIRPLTLKVA
jgi:hypothetical protein